VLASQRPRKFDGPVEITIFQCPKTKRLYDPDNFVKAVFDLLVRFLVISDDNNSIIKRHTVEQSDEKPGYVIVSITPWGETHERTGSPPG
jgi:Holliday junction resolvase RusA-like endonuclease